MTRHRTIFSHELRMLACPQCAAPIEASIAGGSISCGYCIAFAAYHYTFGQSTPRSQSEPLVMNARSMTVRPHAASTRSRGEEALHHGPGEQRGARQAGSVPRERRGVDGIPLVDDERRPHRSIPYCILLHERQRGAALIIRRPIV
jgi:hypothetical protein